MDDKSKPASLTAAGKAVDYLKEDGGFDLAIVAIAATHGVPVPPSIIKRFRTGVGRLIDGSFDLLAGSLERQKARSNFDANLEEAVVKELAQAGTSNLAKNSPAISTKVALSMLNEYGLRFENKAAAAQHAYEELANGPELCDEAPEVDIDVDWLNYFSDIAAQKSNPEMQRLMGKILAGEIRKPGSFSPMTIQVLSTLTPSVAQKFEQLCRVAVNMVGVNSILLNVFPKFLSEGIPEIEFAYIDLLSLRSHQLLANESSVMKVEDSQEATIISTCEKKYFCRLSQGVPMQQIKVLLFSQAGEELCRLLHPEPLPSFEEKLFASFAQPNWVLRPLAT